MSAAFLIERGLPGWAQSVAIQVLINTFAANFDVKPPWVALLAPPDALYAFREFSAACMEAALACPTYAAPKRCDLETRARSLGAWLRRLLNPRNSELPELIRALYAVIGIDACEQAPERLVFHHCYFSERYTPELCAFMSAFDSGFIDGLVHGRHSNSSLVFESRITQGAPCCVASIYLKEKRA